MENKSSFQSDLNKEQLFSQLLDNYYRGHLKNHTFQRVSNKKEQFQGVDVKFTNKKTNQIYHIDEKAQLDYLNEDLPTFAFEISYEKDNNLKDGWFYDESKTTDFYALATGIYADETEGLLFCKVTLVNRKKLLDFLDQKGITKKYLVESFKNSGSQHGKIILDPLDYRKQGYLFYSKTNKAEKPLNLILKLDWLIENKIAKRLV